jgi:hypothetical protein
MNGTSSDSAGDWRTTYPRNLVPVPKDQGISKGYLRPAEGITDFATGPGVGRGGINWQGVHYRVMGSKLVRVAQDGTVTTLGDVGSDGKMATLDYGFDRLAIWSAGGLYYWDGTTLTQVVDPDLGGVNTGKWVAGYYLSTDGTYIIATELNDPTSVLPTKYGSAESDPDPINAIDELRNEVYAFGRYTIEVFQNVGGDNFPFQVVQSAQITKGIVGAHAYCSLGNTFAFLGSGKDEEPAVYVVVPGDVAKISTREIDTLLQSYGEDVLADAFMECRVTKNHQWVLIHLPDKCLIHDTVGSKAVGEPLWYWVDSSPTEEPSTYRARRAVWCYDKWICEDPTSSKLGTLTADVSTHFGADVQHEFSTDILYNAGNSAIVHEVELVCLTGRVALGADPVVWTSYSLDGQTWSQERSARAGRHGKRSQRIAWRTQGEIRHTRMQRFRWTSDAHLSAARLEVSLEPLDNHMKAPNYG